MQLEEGNRHAALELLGIAWSSRHGKERMGMHVASSTTHGMTRLLSVQVLRFSLNACYAVGRRVACFYMYYNSMSN